jgi:peptide/nickel transport system permease protein
MPTFVLKRFLVAFLTLWFIASAIFLLSKLMPGTFGSAQLAQNEGGYYSRSDADTRERTYRQFLHATGQDLPLFYFSLNAVVQPDTLHLVFPERDRLLLQQLAWRYATADGAARFLRSLKWLEQNLTGEQRQQHQAQLYALRHHSSPQELQAAVAGIAERFPAPLVKQSGIQESSQRLLQNSSRFAYLLPVLQWHGVQNQYHRWLTGLTSGSLGNSLKDGRPVLTVLLQAIQNTWWLLVCSMVLASLLSLELALRMVRRNGRRWRQAVLPTLFLLDSVPLFVLAIVLLVLLASPAFLQLFPVYGMGYYSAQSLPWWQALGQWLQYMALPMLCLALANLPYLTNQFYQSLATVQTQDYIRTARAKGLSENRVIRRHMLRNALLPLITLLSDFLPALVAGAVLIETIFAIPGVGRLLLESVLSRDYPVIVGIVVVVAVFRLLAHLLSDLLYAQADPRISTRTA